MTRILLAALALTTSLALAVGPAVATEASSGHGDVEACKKHQAKGPCTTKEFDFERVEKACADSGRKGAASAMRMMMLRANQKRADLKCASCHDDPDEGGYALKPDARKLAKKHFVESTASHGHR